MLRVSLDVGLHGPVPRRQSQALLLELLEWHTKVNAAVIVASKAEGKPIPTLYASGVRYGPERGEHLIGLPAAATASQLDCEDLAAWRAAELRVGGERGARVQIQRLGPRSDHIVVRRADGRIEDPSAVLGYRP